MHLAHAGAQDAGRLALRLWRRDPQVLAAEAVGQGRGGGRAGQPDQPARQDAVAALGRHHEGAERVRGGHEALAVEGGRGGQRHRLDRDPAMRLRGEPAFQLAASGCAEDTRPQHGRGLAGIIARDGLDQRPALGFVQRGGHLTGPAQPARRYVRQQRRLAEQPLEQPLGKRCQGVVLDHAAARPVDHGDVAAACSLHQARDAGEPRAGQMQGVHEVARLLGDDEIDPLQPVQRLQVDLVVAHGEIAALDDRVAQVACEVGVAEIGGARRPRAHEHDPPVVASAKALEALLHAEEVAGEAPRAAVAEQLRQAMAERHPAGQRIAVADRGVGLVAQDHPFARRRPRHVAGVGVEEAPLGCLAVDAGAHEGRAAQEQRRRQAAVLQQPLLAVQVGQDGVDQPGTLQDSGRQALPLVVRQKHRHQVQPPRMRPIVRVGVDVERDAALAQQPPRALRRRRPPLRPHGGKAVDEPAPMRPDAAVRRQHLVESGRGFAVAGQQPIEVAVLVGRVGQGLGQHPGAAQPYHRAPIGCRKRRRESMA